MLIKSRLIYVEKGGVDLFTRWSSGLAQRWSSSCTEGGASHVIRDSLGVLSGAGCPCNKGTTPSMTCPALDAQFQPLTPQRPFTVKMYSRLINVLFLIVLQHKNENYINTYNLFFYKRQHCLSPARDHTFNKGELLYYKIIFKNLRRTKENQALQHIYAYYYLKIKSICTN